MRNLSERIISLTELCKALKIENIDFHRIYVLTIYPDRIRIQGHFSASILELIKKNIDTYEISIDNSGYINIDIESFGNYSEKFEITLT